jgi:orotidine-5'-phosphate decarboxylase
MSKVFLALDTPNANIALGWVRDLVAINPYFKVGLELFTSYGPSFVQEVRKLGGRVFLDLKFHDIPNTVAGASRASVNMGVDIFNIHCGGGSEMMLAAANATEEESKKLSVPKPLLLGVTVLTSLDDRAIQEIGFPRSAGAQVKHFVEMAIQSNLDGVVCSPQEIALVKSLKKDFKVLVPGIRPAGSEMGDQKRVTTPKEAVIAGADFLVVGRPITQAKNPKLALENILKEVSEA